MADIILVVNAGSSSLKFEVFSVGRQDALVRQVRGRVDGIGTHPRLAAYDSTCVALIDEHYPAGEVNDLPAALARAQTWLRDHLAGVMGHLVLHGGPIYAAPTMIDDAVLNSRFVP
ncbi:MAG TPA: hypothetical protein VLX09_05195 [Stellaceae bacterium]|nr:hypothetical protein [Stellaceae bacterium]